MYLLTTTKSKPVPCIHLFQLMLLQRRMMYDPFFHYFNELEQNLTSHYKRVYHSALQAMKHGSLEQP